MINAAYATSQFWDGRAKTLEEQSVGPVGNPIEMGHSMPAMVAQFDKIADYHDRFQKVFGTGVTEEGFAKAVAAFERTILSGNSPYDKFKAGDQKALSDAQKKGMDLFMEDCNTCHRAPLFSNYLFYSAGVGMKKAKPDEGRKDVTGKDRDRGKFRTPAAARGGQHGAVLPRRLRRDARRRRGLDDGRRHGRPGRLAHAQGPQRPEVHARGPQERRRVPQGPFRRVPDRRAAQTAVGVVPRHPLECGHLWPLSVLTETTERTEDTKSGNKWPHSKKRTVEQRSPVW